MQTETITMSAAQLRKMLDTVPANAHKCITPTKVEVMATRKGASAAEVVVTANKVGLLWEVTAPVGLVQQR